MKSVRPLRSLYFIGLIGTLLLVTGPDGRQPEARPGERFFRFRWDPVATAAHYELQMAASPEFGADRVQLETEKALKTVRLKPGRYYWRVRARDKDGRAGEWSPTREVAFTGLPPAAQPPAREEQSPPKKPREETQTRPAELSKDPDPAPEPSAPERPQTKDPATAAKPARAGEAKLRIRQKFDQKTGWESYSLPEGKLLKIIFETADQGAGSDKVLIKVNDRDFQTYPDDRLLLEHDGKYHITSYAIDRVGNRSAMRRRKILIDSSGPQIETRIKGELLELDANDEGVGLESLRWRTGPGDAWRAYTTPIPRAAAGAAGRIEVQARDHLENSATKTFVFRD